MTDLLFKLDRDRTLNIYTSWRVDNVLGAARRAYDRRTPTDPKGASNRVWRGYVLLLNLSRSKRNPDF
eukprot:1320134-Amorphochlora_amoeboformis.AAC.1